MPSLQAERVPDPPPPPPHAADSAAQLYPGLQATPWRRHIKLVVQTPEGLAMSDMVQVLLGSLTNMSTETLADFSSRLPEGSGGVGGGGSGSRFPA